jgi:hypothetical protein
LLFWCLIKLPIVIGAWFETCYSNFVLDKRSSPRTDFKYVGETHREFLYLYVGQRYETLLEICRLYYPLPSGEGGMSEIQAFVPKVRPSQIWLVSYRSIFSFMASCARVRAHQDTILSRLLEETSCRQTFNSKVV